MVNKAQSKQVERVQQFALYVIIGNEYTNYDNAVNYLKVVSEKMCLLEI